MLGLEAEGFHRISLSTCVKCSMIEAMSSEVRAEVRNRIPGPGWTCTRQRSARGVRGGA